MEEDIGAGCGVVFVIVLVAGFFWLIGGFGGMVMFLTVVGCVFGAVIVIVCLVNWWADSDDDSWAKRAGLVVAKLAIGVASVTLAIVMGVHSTNVYVSVFSLVLGVVGGLTGLVLLCKDISFGGSGGERGGWLSPSQTISRSDSISSYPTSSPSTSDSVRADRGWFNSDSVSIRGNDYQVEKTWSDGSQLVTRQGTWGVAEEKVVERDGTVRDRGWFEY